MTLLFVAASGIALFSLPWAFLLASRCGLGSGPGLLAVLLLPLASSWGGAAALSRRLGVPGGVVAVWTILFGIFVAVCFSGGLYRDATWDVSFLRLVLSDWPTWVTYVVLLGAAAMGNRLGALRSEGCHAR
jgi:hypothetical protein